MSQGGRSDTSDFSAVGRLQEGEVVEHVFDDRRCSGNRGREHLCRLVDSEPRWLAAKDVSGDNLTVWEAGEAARVDRRDYERNKKSRAAKREHEKPTLVQTFHDSEPGKMLLSQKINTNAGSGPHRKSDCVRALQRDDFKLHTIRTSDLKRAEAGAVTAGKAFGARAGEYDYLGKHAFTINGFKMDGKIPPEPTFGRFIRREGDKVDETGSKPYYYVSEVEEAIPLGMVVCTHEASNPADVLDVLERHAIVERNKRPGYLRQQLGGKGGALSERPKSDVMLLINGARYKPDAYRAKIKRIDDGRSASSGSRSGRGAGVAKPEGGSSATDALKRMFGL